MTSSGTERPESGTMRGRASRRVRVLRLRRSARLRSARTAASSSASGPSTAAAARPASSTRTSAAAAGTATAGAAGTALAAPVLDQRLHGEAALERAFRALLPAAGGTLGAAPPCLLVALEVLLHRRRQETDDKRVLADLLGALPLSPSPDHPPEPHPVRLPAGSVQRLAQPLQPVAGRSSRVA